MAIRTSIQRLWKKDFCGNQQCKVVGRISGNFLVDLGWLRQRSSGGCVSGKAGFQGVGGFASNGYGANSPSGFSMMSVLLAEEA